MILSHFEMETALFLRPVIYLTPLMAAPYNDSNLRTSHTVYSIHVKPVISSSIVLVPVSVSLHIHVSIPVPVPLLIPVSVSLNPCHSPSPCPCPCPVFCVTVRHSLSIIIFRWQSSILPEDCSVGPHVSTGGRDRKCVRYGSQIPCSPPFQCDIVCVRVSVCVFVCVCVCAYMRIV